MKNNELTEVKAAMPSLEGLPQEVIEYVHGLVAENHALKPTEIPCGAIENGRAFIDRLEAYPFESQGGDLKMCSDWQSLVQCFDYLAEFARGNDIQTPATDAFTAELRAKGVGEFAADMWKRGNELVAEGAQKSLVVQVRLAAKLADTYVDNLRAGRNG